MYKLISFLCFISLLHSCIQSQQSPQGNHSSTATSISLSDNILLIHQDKANNYWFAGDSLFLYNNKTIRHFTTADGLLSNGIKGIQEDAQGTLYFETQKGINRFDGNHFDTLPILSEAESSWAGQASDLWFRGAWDDNRLYRFDGNALHQLAVPEELHPNPPESHPSFSPFGIYSIYKDTKEQLYFGTLCAGVCVYDGQKMNWIDEKELRTLEDGRVPGTRSIIEDKHGQFWLSNTLHRYTIDSNLQYQKEIGILPSDSSLSFPYFMSATQDKDGNLWLVTYDDGVWFYDYQKVVHYPIYDGETKALLFSIHKDRQDGLWLGSHNAGTFRFNSQKNTFERFYPTLYQY